MFQSGDILVFKNGYFDVVEVALNVDQNEYDLWNENDYFLNVNADKLRHATVDEKQQGHRIS